MRLRDNKRRNRQKQKDYTASLSARLNDLQVKGVQATKEVQQSARRVVEDNARLKALLRHVGVTDYMIETWTPGAIEQPLQEVRSGEKQQRAASSGQRVGYTFAETVFVTDSNRIVRLKCIVRHGQHPPKPLLN
jgi:preprotein translocase subunit SecD